MSAVVKTGMQGSARFSPCGLYRYELSRTWGPGPRRTMVFVMLNPSTADERVLDPTVRRCIGFAKREGCTALEVLNIFALRSTNPKALYAHADPIGPENNAALESALAFARMHDRPVVAAWGTHGRLLDRGSQVAAMAQRQGVQLLTLKPTGSGHPGHPLYLRDNAPLTPWSPTT